MSTLPAHTPLHLSTVVALADIAEMARQQSKVAYLRVDREPLLGHVRGLYADADGYQGINADMDIRDAYVRITHRSGAEGFYPIIDLAGAFRLNLFTAYDWD